MTSRGLSADTITDRVRAHFPDATVELTDLTGTADHWRAVIISAAFSGKSLLQRQRMVHAALAAELQGPIHALSFDALAPGEPRPA